MSDQDVADLLNAAADRLERTGWRRYGIGGPDGPNCVVGAILYEATGRFLGLEIRARGAVRDVVYGRDRVGACASAPPPMGWNDHQCADQAEAVAVLRQAADRLVAS